MSKSKHAKQDEFHKEQIRHLKKEIKRKDQKIRQLEKELGYKQNKHSGSSFDEFLESEKIELCPECAKGSLREIIVVGRSIKTCDLCHHRTKARKL